MENVERDIKLQILFALVIFTISCLFTIANYYLTREQQLKFIQSNEDIRRAKDLKSERFELFDQLNSLVGERLYLTRNLFGAISGYYVKENKEIESEYYVEKIKEIEPGYYEARENWNFNIYRLYSLITHYFGKELRNEFEEKINNPLVNMGKEIERILRDGRYFKDLDIKKLTEIQGNILRFNKKALDIIE